MIIFFKNLIKLIIFCVGLIRLGQAQSIDSILQLQADSLLRLTIKHLDRADFEQALKTINFTEKFIADKIGRESSLYGTCCYHYGRVETFRFNFKEAEKWYLRSISVREKVLGKDSPNYAKSIYRLGTLYVTLGNHIKAESLFLKAQNILKKSVGVEDPMYGFNLYYLANLYANLGAYQKAESAYLEVISIRRKAPGNQLRDYAMALHALANLYSKMDEFEKAESLYSESIEIRKKILSPSNPEYLQSLYSLSSLYKKMGNYDKIEPLIQHVAHYRKELLGTKHPEYASCLSVLAELEERKGNLERAKNYYNEVNEIRINSFGEDNPICASGLLSLANIYRKESQFDHSQELFSKAIAIRKKYFGENHIEYASALISHSLLSIDLNQPLEAIEELKKSQKIIENTLGRTSLTYAKCILSMAVLFANMDSIITAKNYFIELSNLNISIIQKAVRHMSVNEFASFVKLFSEYQDQLNLFVSLHFKNDPELLDLCFDNCLIYKGIVLTANSRIKSLAGLDTVLTKSVYDLNWTKNCLATEYSKPLTEANLKYIDSLESFANRIEKSISHRISNFDKGLKIFNWKQVQNQLLPNEVMIEFLRFPNENSKKSGIVQYAAMIIGKDYDHPKFISLFNEIELQISLNINKDGDIKPFIDQLYSFKQLSKIDSVSTDLYQLVWDKIVPEIKDVTTIYYSPVGLLYKVNLAAIPISEKLLISDRYELKCINSARTVALDSVKRGQFKFEQNYFENKAALFGGIKYDSENFNVDSLKLKGSFSMVKNTSQARNLFPSFDFLELDSSKRGNTWYYLKWTEKEVDSINKIMLEGRVQVKLYKGHTGTEDAFKLICHEKPSPRIIHIATHGFFFPNSDINRYDEDEFVGDLAFKTSSQPLIRSGLIFAGANLFWKTGIPYSNDMEDGILSSYEISQLELSNTELVVLSACETGLGDIIGNEGVFGLQRAFKIAGVKFLIMSLWQIADKQTSIFMTKFYKYWLLNNLSIPQAFQATQRDMRNEGTSPYYWAGFILIE